MLCRTTGSQGRKQSWGQKPQVAYGCFYSLLGFLIVASWSLHRPSGLQTMCNSVVATRGSQEYTKLIIWLWSSVAVWQHWHMAPFQVICIDKMSLVLPQGVHIFLQRSFIMRPAAFMNPCNLTQMLQKFHTMQWFMVLDCQIIKTEWEIICFGKASLKNN